MTRSNMLLINLVAVFSLLLSSPSFAQTSPTGGVLEGSVSDSSGALVPAASITIQGSNRSQLREVTTDRAGKFRIAELPPGEYEITVSHPGFAPYRHAGVAVSVGSAVQLAIVLHAESLSTQVTVTAQPPAIDSSQTSVSSVIDTERIEELPVESRNYLNFVLLAPGVAGSAEQPAKKSLAPLPDSGFSFGGLRGRSNNITIDGLENNDEYIGASRTELSLETVQEFQVVNAGFSAETGGASGGSINVITRTGTNAIHGDAFVFLQNGELDAANPFETERVRPDLHRYRAGLAIGGPLLRDRTFYQAGFEQEHNRALDDSFIDPAAVAQINRILASGLLPQLQTRAISDNPFPTARAETEASLKLNHQATRKNSLMLRYAFTNNREAGDAFNISGLTDASARGSSFIEDHSVTGALTSVFGPASVGDLRFQFATRHALSRTNDAAGAGAEITGVAGLGRPYEGNGRRTETHDQLTYSYSHDSGHHLWKAGLAFDRVREDSSLMDGFGGLYIFTSLATFAAGQPDQFRQAFGDARTDYAVTSYGAFFQDHWSVSPKVTADIGVRYDFEHLPNGFPEARRNFSPRIGLAYKASSSWVVRAGYGIFFDRYLLAALNRAIQKNGTGAYEAVLAGSEAIRNPVATASMNAALSFDSNAFSILTTPSVYTIDPGLATPYSAQTSVAVEHLLAPDMTASASYLLVRGVKLSRTRNINLAGGGPAFGPARADSRFDGIYQLEDSANSTYQGLSLTLNRRMAEELEFSASYTLSRTFDDASDYNEQPQNPFDLAAEWALSRQDQRHRLVFNALWELPIGDEDQSLPSKQKGWITKFFEHIEVAPILSIQSGRPINPLTGADNGTHAYPLAARPSGWGRNSLQSPFLANLDFRLLKYFPIGRTAHLDLVAEAFNLLNRTNVSQINPFFGVGAAPQAGFGQPITATGSRQIQFSLDFEF